MLCWIAVALDGFDLVVLGAVIPTIDKTHALGFTPASLTAAVLRMTSAAKTRTGDE